ncbi:alternative ribosome rescue aminoacyl-tRNA hydrolase ArfB [Sphingomonas oryzagri]|uniref:Alternative ribosome rescue aminoacyl-tRNA hydrolase ArfB n=1 Tax=Sphingomonas oryzagri TaxID=3042314 RepID=A0ABT6N6V0_9SPHN|nr:alternative ribosome rescue aminoacyl-tRNA hydrolase ArfB [Sphingomonas oryzagri]MDH7640820.1 alternative ribosome rescue aminoacyl-tRNA hydrolase ArfB [Sphingomonas oryzagri]
MPEPYVLPEEALEERFLASTGPGGQNVNKVATAVQLRVDVYALRLPPAVFQRLKALAGSRWVEGGAILVTAREYRTREANREAARARIVAMIEQALVKPERRIKTKPTKASKERRLTAKSTRSGVKAGRGKVRID